MNLPQFKEKFEPFFDTYLRDRLKEMEGRLSDAFLKSIMVQAARLARKGGKRARPFLAYSMYKISGGKSEEIGMRIAIGIELFHMFCLIHDDITDRGKIRHGEQTIHEFAYAHMKKEKRRGDLMHVAESQAMLAGDLVYSWAYERIAGLRGVSEDVHREALGVFIDAMQDVVAGQMIDVDITTRKDVPLSLLMKKMELKTASYTFVRPLELGAVLAGASKETREFCHNFGMVVGTAFQLQDDLLDIIGTQKQLGKMPLGDIREGQHTPISHDAMKRASDTDKKTLTHLFGAGKLSQDEIKKIKRIFVETGSLRRAEDRIAEGFKKGRELLSAIEIPQKGKEVLVGILEILEHRTT